VIDSAGRVIGVLDGLILNPETWSVEALRVKLHRDITKELGATRGAFRRARVDVPIDYVQHASDTVILKGPIGGLSTLEARDQAPA
jgi:sporulation protein YlmC with PRC-barrel domain